MNRINNRTFQLGLVIIIASLGASFWIFNGFSNFASIKKSDAAQQSDVVFTCTVGRVDKCLNVNANWDGQSCGITYCPNGDTNGDRSCGVGPNGDQGATFEAGSCSEMLSRIAGLPENKCYQLDTIISTGDARWCDLTKDRGSYCNGYASNLSTCRIPTPTPTIIPTQVPTPTPTMTPTPTVVPTPVNTPTATPTPTPTYVPGEPNYCGGTCGSNYNCQPGYFCLIQNGQTSGYCRNPQCSGESDCSCKASPTAPAVLGISTTKVLPKTGGGISFVLFSTLMGGIGVFMFKKIKGLR